MKSYYVYMHTSPNGKSYVGITRNIPERRWRNGKGYAGNEYFSRAIKKYGWENFQTEVLYSGLSKEDAETLEIKLISDHKLTNRDFGYNIEHGGNSCGTHSEETKRKISLANMGNKHCAGRKLSDWHKQQLLNANIGVSRHVGRKASIETKLAISKALTGRKLSDQHIQHLIENHRDQSGSKNPMFGKKHSAETKRLISKKAKERKLTDDQRLRLTQIAKRRPVEQLTKEGVVLERFSSLKAAADKVGAFSQNIGQACKCKTKTCKGFYWRYIGENCD